MDKFLLISIISSYFCIFHILLTVLEILLITQNFQKLKSLIHLILFALTLALRSKYQSKKYNTKVFHNSDPYRWTII